VRVAVYILDYLVKGSGKLWSRAALECEEDPITDRKQLASIPEADGFHARRSCLRFASWVVGSSFSQFETDGFEREEKG
jgi:hypothetical protein